MCCLNAHNVLPERAIMKQENISFFLSKLNLVHAVNGEPDKKTRFTFYVSLLFDVRTQYACSDLKRYMRKIRTL